MRTLYLWPCNVPAWQAWQAVRTQWRVGAGGATGLDYAGVRAELDETGPPTGTPARRDLWAGIKACEAATLDAWAEARAVAAERQAREQHHQARGH